MLLLDYQVMLTRILIEPPDSCGKTFEGKQTENRSPLDWNLIEIHISMWHERKTYLDAMPDFFQKKLTILQMRNSFVVFFF